MRRILSQKESFLPRILTYSDGFTLDFESKKEGIYLNSTLREEIFAGRKFREFWPNSRKSIPFLTLKKVDSRKLIPAKSSVKPNSRKLIPAKCPEKKSRKLIPAIISSLKVKLIVPLQEGNSSAVSGE